MQTNLEKKNKFLLSYNNKIIDDKVKVNPAESNQKLDFELQYTTLPITIVKLGY